MSIDYEKSFKKLVDQIKTEYGWTLEEIDESCGGTDFYRGMESAYKSIKDLAEELENGKFDFGDETEDREEDTNCGTKKCCGTCMFDPEDILECVNCKYIRPGSEDLWEPKED